MGPRLICSRLDQEAFKALMDYRLAIGLSPSAEFERPEKSVQLGEFIDGLRPWDLFRYRNVSSADSAAEESRRLRTGRDCCC